MTLLNRSTGKAGLALGIGIAMSGGLVLGGWSSLAGKTPQQTLSGTLAAMKAKGSCRWGENIRWGGVYEHSNTSSGATQGSQTLVGTLWGTGTILLVSPDWLYARGNATFLESVLSVKTDQAAKYSGRWISVPSYSDPSFASVTAGLTLSSLEQGIKVVPPLSLTKPTRIGGRDVIGVSGWAPDFAKGDVVDTLYVTTGAPYLPVELLQHGRANGATFSATDPYVGWGERVSVASSIPYSSLPVS